MMILNALLSDDMIRVLLSLTSLVMSPADFVRAISLARLRKSGLDTAAITALCSFVADSLVLTHFQLNDVALTTYIFFHHIFVIERGSGRVRGVAQSGGGNNCGARGIPS